VVCLGPRGPGEIVGPRPLSDVVVRPLNFTVRRHGSAHCHARRHLPLRCDSASCSTAAPHSNELQLFDLPSLRCALGVLQADFG
jgi:hypothetical protein